MYNEELNMELKPLKNKHYNLNINTNNIICSILLSKTDLLMLKSIIDDEYYGT
jgi:hypothetical protein